VFAQGVIVCVTVTASALVTVLCYLCVLKCLLLLFIHHSQFIISSTNEVVFLPWFVVCLSAGLLNRLWTNFYDIIGRIA